MGFLSFHVTHRWADPATLERFARVPGQRILRALHQLPGVSGCVSLVTCHRSEVYLTTRDPETAKRALSDFFLSPRFHKLVAGTGEEFRPTAPPKTLEGEETVRHLFRVAAGLDSVLLGEDEIQGQVRQALRLAEAEKSADVALRRLFQRALEMGRRARRTTRLGQTRSSFGVAAVDAARTALGSLRGRHVVLVGAGQAARAVATALAREEIEGLDVVNRTRPRAQSIAADFEARAHSLAALPARLRKADVAVFAVRVKRPLVSAATIKTLAQRRRPLVIVDLSYPPSIAPYSNGHGSLRLITFQSLVESAGPAQQADPATVRTLEAMIEEAVRDFERRRQEPDALAGQLLRRINTYAETTAAAALEKALRRLPELSPETRAVLEDLVRSLQTKLLSGPTLALRKALEEGRHDLARAAAELFQLNGSSPKPAPRRTRR